jgi:hypothetical protein
VLVDEPESYEGRHGQDQQFVDIQAQLLLTVRDNLIIFKASYM